MGYIKEERVKIQFFHGGLPPSYRDRVEFANPQTLEETIRMVIHCYEQSKGKTEARSSWKGKLKK